MSTLGRVADAVVAELNAPQGHTWSQPFTGARHQIPRYELEDLKALHITVIPRALEIASASRADNAWDAEIWLGIQKKVSVEDGEDVDDLMDLTEEVVDYFIAREVLGNGLAELVKAPAIDPAYDPQHLDEKGVFTALVHLTYRVIKNEEAA